MSARNFRSFVMVTSCASAALGCYLVSLRVASERASLEDVETQIVMAQRDLRVLQTEIGTRGRMAQLERWNASVLALSAPSADQFLRGGFELARLTKPDHAVEFDAPVVLASAPAPPVPKAPIGADVTDDSGVPATPALSPTTLVHQASLKTETREVPVKPAAPMPRAAGPKFSDRPVTAAKPASTESLDKPGLAAAKSPRAAGTVTTKTAKPLRIADRDPLAPLPQARPGKTRQDPSSSR